MRLTGCTLSFCCCLHAQVHTLLEFLKIIPLHRNPGRDLFWGNGPVALWPKPQIASSRPLVPDKTFKIQKWKLSKIEKFKNGRLQKFKNSMFECLQRFKNQKSCIGAMRVHVTEAYFSFLNVWGIQRLNFWVFEFLNFWMFENLPVSPDFKDWFF